MEIKTYNPSQLREFIGSSQFKQMRAIPISTHRALSHISNPRAQPDDVLMVIAFENDEMAGYLGVLPDVIYNMEATAFKSGFLSCLWVNRAMRGKGIAKQLLSAALESWNGNVLGTEFTAEARALYFGSGNFTDLKVLNGLRCYRRFNLHEVLPKKDEKLRPLKPLLKLGDAVANIPNDIRLSIFKPKKYNSSIRFVTIDKVDEELNAFIAGKQSHNLERRGGPEINWIIEKPWILQSKPTEESRRYHFSSVDERFKNLLFKIVEGDEIRGFLMFTLRNTHLKIPYVFFDREIVDHVGRFVYRLMQEQGVDMLTIFNKELADYFRQNATPFIYKRKIKRHFIITKKLAPFFTDATNLNIQDGDADCAFT